MNLSIRLKLLGWESAKEYQEQSAWQHSVRSSLLNLDSFSVGPTVQIASVHRFAASLLLAGPPTPQCLFSRSDEASNRNLVLRFLVSHVVVALTLMQAAFLNLFDDPLLSHRFGPLTTPLIEVSRCFLKRLLNQLSL